MLTTVLVICYKYKLTNVKKRPLLAVVCLRKQKLYENQVGDWIKEY
jgi:hypothetical protein